jgi:uncharacterized membrane protein
LTVTSVPKPYFGPLGFVAPDESTILAGVLADFQAAFGGNLNPAQETPHGQLMVSLAAVIGFCNDVFLAYTNGVDPKYAEGRMQDGIARIYFLTRNSAEPTVVSALCSGQYGTTIPAGSLARAADGNIYACTTGGQIGVGGVVTLSFACLTPGPVVCPPGALATILRQVAGWDSVTNLAAGVLGRNVESRDEFEVRRAASVAANASGVLGAIRGHVLAVPNVLDAFVYENSTAAAITYRGVAVPARTLYVSVAGGLDTDVAKAIFLKKPPGCGMLGNTTVPVPDPNPGYAFPPPSYSITFQRPAGLAVQFRVTLENSVNVPGDALAQIRVAIEKAFSGTGATRARIGSTVHAARFYPVVTALGAWAQVLLIEVASANNVGVYGPTCTVNMDQVPTVIDGDIGLTLV